ncbi:DUF4834 domain-containing protein [Mucilaginibacter pallidiroseus]|uniref:DUF4834 domain-containing protein n=1 Tax=Mucilaginibacter pallidiroseus TaxID=2599295 RepID=A0A563UGC2_9SPHI|nr:DUF4834 domain-containing protein [Mucilaginibacter pallidiroseus]TWR30404.1 DUF4834 domain-containing protein [Mucilaginibacter pallidiroseus]
MVLIRFLIISICVLYIIRSLVRIFLPMLFQGFVNKAQEQARQQQNYYQQRPPEGRIKVDHIPADSRKSSIPDTEGDFVEYEEIKEK